MRGLVIGKFLPFHLGHKYLIDSGFEVCDHIDIIVVEGEKDDYDITLRKQWIQSIYGDSVSIHTLSEHLPRDGRFSKDDQEKWMHAIMSYVPSTDYVIASEHYIETLCDKLDAQALYVDVKRIEIPISGSLIRSEPNKYLEFLPESVRDDVRTS